MASGRAAAGDDGSSSRGSAVSVGSQQVRSMRKSTNCAVLATYGCELTSCARNWLCLRQAESSYCNERVVVMAWAGRQAGMVWDIGCWTWDVCCSVSAGGWAAWICGLCLTSYVDTI
jgi:hypothetical protein